MDARNYGTLTTKVNEMPVTPGSFVSEADMMVRILITPATTGSEAQRDYANNLKARAMQTVDRVAASLTARGANEDRTLAWRNRLMAAIDADTDSRHLIDSLKFSAGSVEDLAKIYNVMP